MTMHLIRDRSVPIYLPFPYPWEMFSKSDQSNSNDWDFLNLHGRWHTQQSFKERANISQLSDSLKPVVRPFVCSSVCSSVRQNHFWARRDLQPSARKKPHIGGLLSSNFICSPKSLCDEYYTMTISNTVLLLRNMHRFDHRHTLVPSTEYLPDTRPCHLTGAETELGRTNLKLLLTLKVDWNRITWYSVNCRAGTGYEVVSGSGPGKVLGPKLHC